MSKPFFRFVLTLSIAACWLAACGRESERFDFNAVATLDDMRAVLTMRAPLGTPRETVRKLFVEEGGARLYLHPKRPRIEKYVYDINVCKQYVWRWNISANFDEQGGLTQVFMNGEPIHDKGDRPLDHNAIHHGGKETLYKAWRARPEASDGESKIAYVLLDKGPNTNDIDDEFVIVAGPSRAGPSRLAPFAMGQMHAYNGERWRSIVDDEPANKIEPFHGKCKPE